MKDINYVTVKCSDALQVNVPADMVWTMRMAHLVRGERSVIGDYRLISDYRSTEVLQVPGAFYVKS